MGKAARECLSTLSNAYSHGRRGEAWRQGDVRGRLRNRWSLGGLFSHVVFGSLVISPPANNPLVSSFFHSPFPEPASLSSPTAIPATAHPHSLRSDCEHCLSAFTSDGGPSSHCISTKTPR